MLTPKDSDGKELPKPVREWTRIVGDDVERGQLNSLPAPIREWTKVKGSEQLELSAVAPRAQGLRQTASGENFLD